MIINSLIKALLAPKLGEFALSLYDGLRNNEITLDMVSDLMVTLHRLCMCSFYEIPDIDFGDVGIYSRYRYTLNLLEDAASFVELCLKKIIIDNIAVKHDSLVSVGDCTLNIRELINKLDTAFENFSDSEEATYGWFVALEEFISWTPDNNDSCCELLNIMDSTNSDIIFGFCSEYGHSISVERLKENQPINPEDFNTIKGIFNYHDKMIHTEYFNKRFFEESTSNEQTKVLNAHFEAMISRSIKELLLELAKEDVYLDCEISFPYTVYQLLTDKSFDIQLKKDDNKGENS